MALLQTSHLPPSEASYPKMSSGRIPSVEGGIQPTIFDAKADILTATAADTPARLAVGTNGQFLSANSSTATGLEWVAAPSSGANWSLLNSGGTALTGAQTITVSGISGKDKIMILVSAASSASAGSWINVRLNGDTATNYWSYGPAYVAQATYAATNLDCITGQDSNIILGRMSSNAGSNVFGYVQILGCNSAGVKVFTSAGAGRAVGGSTQEGYWSGGYYDSSSTISSISIRSTSGNFDAGTVFVYTSA
jgi:hypothetical protein